MANCMAGLLEKRRSIYNLGSKEILNDEAVIELIKNAVKNCPSAFNSQSARVLILLGEHHHKFWKMVHDILQAKVPADKFASTAAKIAGFDAARGTILYFEDMDVVHDLQARFPLYRENFEHWSEQSAGMLQYIVWTALAEQNIGASLQHYNPLVDDAVSKEWKVPASWRLVAEMPFGSIEAPADEKSFLPLDDRVKIFR